MGSYACYFITWLVHAAVLDRKRVGEDNRAVVLPASYGILPFDGILAPGSQPFQNLQHVHAAQGRTLEVAFASAAKKHFRWVLLT